MSEQVHESCWILYMMSYEGGTPAPLPSILFTELIQGNVPTHMGIMATGVFAKTLNYPFKNEPAKNAK